MSKKKISPNRQTSKQIELRALAKQDSKTLAEQAAAIAEKRNRGKVKHHAIINGKACTVLITPEAAAMLGEKPYIFNQKPVEPNGASAMKRFVK